MSISKKLRFQVFRRDGHACLYCGRRAPKVTLEVDHRIPRCMGGSDDPGNLISACWDCNRGKGPLPFEGRVFEQWEYNHGSWEEWAEDSAPEPWPDVLPHWMLPKRCFGYLPISLNFDIYKAASEIPAAAQVYADTLLSVVRRAEAFDALD